MVLAAVDDPVDAVVETLQSRGGGFIELEDTLLANVDLDGLLVSTVPLDGVPLSYVASGFNLGTTPRDGVKARRASRLPS